MRSPAANLARSAVFTLRLVSFANHSVDVYKRQDRTVEENLDLFERMKNGEFEDGSHTLRAKIDMASPNINMRDPVIYLSLIHI